MRRTITPEPPLAFFHRTNAGLHLERQLLTELNEATTTAYKIVADYYKLRSKSCLTIVGKQKLAKAEKLFDQLMDLKCDLLAEMKVKGTTTTFPIAVSSDPRQILTSEY